MLTQIIDDVHTVAFYELNTVWRVISLFCNVATVHPRRAIFFKCSMDAQIIIIIILLYEMLV